MKLLVKLYDFSKQKFNWIVLSFGKYNLNNIIFKIFSTLKHLTLFFVELI